MPTPQKPQKHLLGSGSTTGLAVLFTLWSVVGSEPVNPSLAYVGASEPGAPPPGLEARTPRQKLLSRLRQLHHGPPDRVSGVAGLLWTEQGCPGLGAQAVRAHEDVGPLLAATQKDRHAALILLEAFHLGAEAQRSLANLSHEQDL